MLGWYCCVSSAVWLSRYGDELPQARPTAPPTSRSSATYPARTTPEPRTGNASGVRDGPMLLTAEEYAALLKRLEVNSRA